MNNFVFEESTRHNIVSETRLIQNTSLFQINHVSLTSSQQIFSKLLLMLVSDFNWHFSCSICTALNIRGFLRELLLTVDTNMTEFKTHNTQEYICFLEATIFGSVTLFCSKLTIKSFAQKPKLVYNLVCGGKKESFFFLCCYHRQTVCVWVCVLNVCTNTALGFMVMW